MIRALDIVQEIMRSASLPVPTAIDTISSTSAEDRQIREVIQELNYVGLMLGRFINWRWLEKQYIFRTTAEYTTGDADVTEGSANVTSNHASTVWTTAMVGRAFKTAAYQELYRIKSVESSTSMTLEQVFNGDTATDQSYTIAQDRYLLPSDLDTELNVLQFVTPDNLELVPSREFDRLRFESHSGHHLGLTTGLVTNNPRVATIRGSEDGKPVLVLHPFPDDAIQIIINYYSELQELSRDNDHWGFPLSMKPVLRDGTIARYRENAQDDARSQFDMQMFFANRAELAGLRRATDNHPSFIPPTGMERMAQQARKSRLNQLGENFIEISGWGNP
jgi:hypothetical protein